MGTKPKLRTYKIIKANISPEEYLLLNKHQRSLFPSLKSGTLSLAIETGCFTNVILESRTGILCINDKIKNEIHFLCDCPQSELIHPKYYETSNNLKPWFSNLDNESKLLYVSKKIILEYLVTL